MIPEAFIFSALAALPERKIEGKKRLQKLAMLMQFAGLSLETEFILHHYGPYSAELADAAVDLVLMGVIDEDQIQVTSSRLFQTVYKLPDVGADASEFSPDQVRLIQTLDSFTTVQLEMASTVAFFLRQGVSLKDAIGKATTLKPTKAIPSVMEKVDNILEIVGAKECATHGHRATHS